MRFLVTFFVLAEVYRSIHGFVPFAAAGMSRKVFPSSLPLSPVEDISLGAPYSRPTNGAYISAGGVKVDVEVEDVVDSTQAISDIVDMLDNHKGVLLTSSYEYPGRYSRWTVGFTAPALQIEGRGLDFEIKALNERGSVLISIIEKHLKKKQFQDKFTVSTFQGTSKATDLSGNVRETQVMAIKGKVIPSEEFFKEEERSKQNSIFTILRELKNIFFHEKSGQLGLYGSFGYDLTFQFEEIALNNLRNQNKGEGSQKDKDLILFFPDKIFVQDNQKRTSFTVKYDFTDLTGLAESDLGAELKMLPGYSEYAEKRSAERSGESDVVAVEAGFKSTRDLPRMAAWSPYVPAAADKQFEKRDYPRGYFAESVKVAKEEFRVGNLFEVVLSQAFREVLKADPSVVFRRLCERNPSPYGFFMNLGSNEYLIGSSPEMFVRVEKTKKGMRVETCPISGTIERGSDPLEDAEQVKKLLSNKKEESELTMCTDVDRNDKSRICHPGTVKILGRRQIEMYSKLIHTVDHVEGYLREGFDSLDAFLCHTWAVTVTGAPKTWAIRFIEKMEKSSRNWYGGAVGLVGFDGALNTGLTLRTIRVMDGIAEVRAGATLLHDSDPESEEKETELKASALIDAITREDSRKKVEGKSTTHEIAAEKKQKKVLLIDHEDSFVHTLANYLRQTGAEVAVCRSGKSLNQFIAEQVDTGAFHPDICVLSPGPGSPSDFFLSETIGNMISRKVPIFGVCLGLQGLFEYFGGELGILGYPMHGKPSIISRAFADVAEEGGQYAGPPVFDVLRGLPEQFQVARYHSLHGTQNTLPPSLIVTASVDDVIMAIQHKSMPIAAVQFHPESLLTLPKNGMKILENALEILTTKHYE